MTSPSYPAYWAELVANDRAAHAAEAERSAQVELESLRTRCADLSAALVQARAAIDVRQEILLAQAAAIAERDEALARARERVAAAPLTGARRVLGVARRAAGRARAVAGRVRGRA